MIQSVISTPKANDWHGINIVSVDTADDSQRERKVDEMFHLCAYVKSNMGTVANTDVPALTDSVLSISNNHFRLVDPASLVGAAYLGATAIRGRLDSPTLRINGQPYILPVNVGVTPVDRGKYMDLIGTPLGLPSREEIAFQGTANPGTTELATALLWLQYSREPVSPGKVYWVRATSTTAAVSQAWTNLALTFDSALPSGYWAVVGSEHQSTNAIAHRLIFPGKVYRPGFTSRTAEGNLSPHWNYDGSFGELGRFVNDNPFQVEALVNGTDAAHVFYFGLVQVGSL